MRLLLPGCLALGALSLLLPSIPSYDPWAWLVWGRELSAGQLNTFAGPSWKPLPPLLTGVYTQLTGSDAAVSLWLVTVRAAGLLALGLAWRLAARLLGGGRWGAAAGALAALMLLLSPDYLRYLAHGNEVPLAAAFVLGAVLRHLDGRLDHALVLGALASLLRPEAFPFLALYALFVWRSHPRTRVLVAGIAIALPMLWIGPEWLGSGDPLGGGRQAASAPSWSLASHDRPWLAVLERAHRMTGPPVELGALAAVAFAAVRRNRPVLVLGAGVLAWTALVVAMTQAGFSGNPRYLTLALVMACVLAGVGCVELVRGARQPVVAAAVAAVLATVAAPSVRDRLDGLGEQAVAARELAAKHTQLVSAVGRMGGPARLRALGPSTTDRAFQPHLAWVLEVSMDRVERPPRPAIVLRAEGPLAGPPARPPYRTTRPSRGGGGTAR